MRKGTGVSDERLMKLVKALESGASPQQVAERYGISKSSLCRYKNDAKHRELMK